MLALDHGPRRNASINKTENASMNYLTTKDRGSILTALAGMKQKNVPADADRTHGVGDSYTFTAINRLQI